MFAPSTTAILLVYSLMLVTTQEVHALSEKSCKTRANKAVEKYVSCYIRAEGKSTTAKRASSIRTCLKTFKRKHNQVRKRSGCKKVLPKTTELVASLDDGCLELGYDGNTCVQDAATFIAGDVACCDREDFIFCFIGNAVCCSDGQYSCPNGMTTEYVCRGEVVDLSNPDDAPAFGQECRVGCTKELRICPVGKGSGRDGRRGCNFTPCCCDPQEEPGQFGNPIGREGYACCRNGEWTTNNLGDGRTFFCPESKEGTLGPFGRRCVS